MSIVTCRRSGTIQSPCAFSVLMQREDVVPAAAVERHDVVAQLVQDLVHLERGPQRLDQHRDLDRLLRNLQRVLRVVEDRVPQPRLEVRLHLRQVEVRAGAVLEQRPWRCGRSTGAKSTMPPGAGLPSIRRCFSRAGASRADARSAWRSRWLSLYSLPSGEVKSILRRTASRRLIWPSIISSQVGLAESSKSAMKHFAPELSALMIILRSTGPVISTRRSCRSAGMPAIFHLPLRTFSVSLRKPGSLPASIGCLALLAVGQQLVAGRAVLAHQFGDEIQRFRGQDAFIAGFIGAAGCRRLSAVSSSCSSGCAGQKRGRDYNERFPLVAVQHVVGQRRQNAEY